MRVNMKILASGSDGNAYVIEHDNKFVLLDLGIGLPEIKQGIGFRVSDILCAFVSHVHL